MTDRPTPFWRRPKVVLAQVILALALAVGVVLLVDSPAARIAAALLVGSALLRVLAWRMGRGPSER
ncbi:MAG: hypothetical protein JWP66_1548 [Naasia sp.]|nr:hypothetical protein [Naasia sp.]